MTVKETLAELVGINSVSSRSNVEITEYLARSCQKIGLRVWLLPYPDDNGIEKVNLIALAGTEFSKSTQATSVELALVGHTDTVPYDAGWSEATTLIEREGKLYGRGACDTKGFIAATLTAVERLDLARLHRPFALIFTADEEIGLQGARRLVQSKPLRARYSIVGEPTSLQPIRAGKGYSAAEVVVRGREAHSAYPALGVSAIFRAVRLISRIEAIAEQIQEEQHPHFDPTYTTLNIGVIRGGSAKNVIAGECRFTLEWRPIPTQDSSRVLDLLNSAIEREKLIDPGFECEVDASRTDAGFETSQTSPLVTLLEGLTGKPAGTVAFGTEAAQIGALGAEAVVLGPGDIRVAHRTGEFVPLDELQRCMEIITQAITSLCF
jgi:acetylornithine deacetylase